MDNRDRRGRDSDLNGSCSVPRLLKDRVAVVTGGGTGIGLAVAKRLGALGARIVIGSRNSANLEAGSAELRHAGLDPLTVQIDVRNPEQVDEIVERTVKHFGHIDILVNNAAGNFICRAEDLSPNGWNAVVGIVLNGTFYCSRAVGRHMIAPGPGRIDRLDPRELRLDGQRRHHPLRGGEGGRDVDDADAGRRMGTPRIRVNAVAPGPIESPGAAKQLWDSAEAVDRITEAVPLKRWGKPEEVADAVAFLVSEHAGYITGEVLTVDGGAWLGRGPFQFLRPRAE